jgi:hypothetical protein
MPGRQTYFEQVPIAEIQTVLERDLEFAELLEKAATPIPELKSHSTRRIVAQKTKAPSKGPL